MKIVDPSESESQERLTDIQPVDKDYLIINFNMSSKMMYGAVAFLLCAVWIQSSSSSAIPMWEYLSRGEKVNTPHPPTACMTSLRAGHH